MNQIRHAANAGRFYDSSPERLRAFVDEAIHQANPEPALRAIVVPHAGYVYSGNTAGQAFSLIAPDAFERVILIGPSHYAHFNGVSVPSYDAYDLPLGELKVDTELRDRLLAEPDVSTVEQAHAPEHCLEVQLPFIKNVLPNARILPILHGHLDRAATARVAAALKAVWDERTLIVISTDFTHYGYHFNYHPFPTDEAKEKLPSLDKRGAQFIVDKDADGFRNYLDETGATICGRGPLLILLDMLDESTEVTLLEYTNSAMVSGDYNSCVGYVAMAVTSAGEENEVYSEADKENMLTVAREAIAARLKNEPYRAPADLSSHMYEDGSCFVTLRIGGNLRGCIGSLEAREPLIENIAGNAVSAAFRDPRFGPLRPEEFDSLDVHVSVLTPSKPVAGYEEIVLGKHGVILKSQGRRSVFLPEVAIEQGWDRVTMLQHLSMKAGLPVDAWKQADFEVFESICFGDDDI